MSTGPRYRVSFRRRREGKTDYQQRRGLALSGLPRMVIRGSLRNLSVQLIKAQTGGDLVIASAHTNELIKKFGWQGGGGNLSAAYLTGLLCGYKAAANGVKKAVTDLGLHAPTKGSRVFAALRGVRDAGVIVPCDEDKLPDEKLVQGQPIAEYAKQLSSTPELYQKRFADQLSRGLRPEEVAEHFAQVKQKISAAFPKVEAPEKKEGEEETPPTQESEKAEKPRRKKTAGRPAKARIQDQAEPEKTEEKK